MATIKDESGELELALSTWESIGALHRSPRARIKNLVKVSKVDDPWTKAILRGMRAPGTGIPYVIMLGTMRYRGGKDFCAIYKRKPAYILEFVNEDFNRWIVTMGAFPLLQNLLSRRS